MAKKTYKCRICNKNIDAENDDLVNSSNFKTMYYHAECYKGSDKSKEDAIFDYLKETLGSMYNEDRSKKLLNQYKKENKTLDNILITLKYWFDVKNGNIYKANGSMGIVQYVYDEAVKWNEQKKKVEAENKRKFEQQNKIAQINKEKNSSRKYDVIIEPTQKPKRMKFFNLD